MSFVESPNQTSLQWADIIDIHDVAPVGEQDYDCLEEIRDVLKKHGKQDRFGVMLIHKHFDLSEDEVLMEYTDTEARIQTIKPVPKNSLSDNSIETSWVFNEGGREAMLTCNTRCWKDIHGNHQSQHV